jgi:hypothetical protein
MKKLLFIIGFLAFSSVTFATTHRVNNNTGNNNNANSATFYTTWASAYTAAASGDTIIVEPSATPYTTAAITLTKKLTIIGNGFAGFIPTGVQINSAGSVFHSLIFGTGSNGSYISGLTFNNWTSANNTNGGIIIAADDIVIQRCRTTNINFAIGFSGTTTTNNTFIKECYFDAGYIASDGTSANANIIIKNNILRSGGIYFSANDVNIAVENNILQWASINSDIQFNNANIAFNNNIIRGAIGNSSNATMNNNICIGASNLPVGNGNLNNIAYSSIFNGTAPPATDDARLKSGSVALGAGTGGNDIGAYNTFAGSSTYVQGGVPNFPSLYYFNIGAISNNIMNVTISAKGNN